MMAAYVIATVVGLGLVLASLAGVIHDGDLDHGGDVDHGIDHGHLGDGGAHADHGSSDHAATHGPNSNLMSWLPFLSLRFWIFGLAVFGAVGLLVGGLTDLVAVPTLLTAVASGALAGSVVSTLFRASRRLESDAGASSAELTGRTATVVVAIRPGSVGKVRLQARGTTEEILAVSDGGVELGIGTEVLVTQLRGARAVVIPMAELLPPEARPVPPEEPGSQAKAGPEPERGTP